MPAAPSAPIATASCRSSTRSIRWAARASTSTAYGIATRTASPSAMVPPAARSTTRPASQHSAMTGATAATTPTRRVAGERSASRRPIPPSSAPFPTGTTIAPGGRSSWSSTSSAISAYPPYCASSAPSAKNGTPSAAATRSASSFARSKSAPKTRISPPWRSIRSTLARVEPSGAYTIARIPSLAAAHADAAPWFPVDAVTTVVCPASRKACIAGSAPRHLNAPSSCSSSRFSHTSRPGARPAGAGSSRVAVTAGSLN